MALLKQAVATFPTQKMLPIMGICHTQPQAKEVQTKSSHQTSRHMRNVFCKGSVKGIKALLYNPGAQVPHPDHSHGLSVIKQLCALTPQWSCQTSVAPS